MADIRATRTTDAEALSAFVNASWRRTYGPIMGAETVDRECAERHQPARLSSECDDGSVSTIVAIGDEGSVAGHAMAFRQGDILFLERLHVDPKHQGTGLADRLLDKVLAGGTDARAVELHVLDGNDRAIAYYRKRGFKVAETTDACGGIAGVPALIMRRETGQGT